MEDFFEDSALTELGEVTTNTDWLLIYDNDTDTVKKIHPADLSSGGSAINLASVGTNIIPSANDTYHLGSSSKRWNDVWAHDVRATDILQHGTSSGGTIGLYGTSPVSQAEWADVTSSGYFTVTGRAGITTSTVTGATNVAGLTFAVTAMAAIINSMIRDLQRVGMFSAE